jgi:hypothetical protein
MAGSENSNFREAAFLFIIVLCRKHKTPAMITKMTHVSLYVLDLQRALDF